MLRSAVAWWTGPLKPTRALQWRHVPALADHAVLPGQRQWPFENPRRVRVARRPSQSSDANQHQPGSEFSWRGEQLTASFCHLLIEHRIRIAGSLPLGFIIGALVLQITINLLPMGEIEGDSTVDLLQCEH